MVNCKLTVIAPCLNECSYIDAFIRNMLSQDFPKEDVEIIIIDGLSNDGTTEIILNYASRYPFIKLLTNEKKTVPYALNMAIKEAHGEYIIRVDLHAIYPVNYFTELVNKYIELKADNIGGVCETIPAKNNTLCRAIATVMSNGFGVGNSYFRIGATAVIKVDTVPFGCFKRELFDEIGLFNEDLTRNHDDEFNGRIVKNGGAILLLPNLTIKYYARDSVKKLSLMFYQYGLFKPLVFKKLGSLISIRQIIPLCFLLWLITGGIMSFFSTALLIIYTAVILIYFISSIYFTRKKIKQELKQVLYLPWLFVVVHLSYGLGYLRGIIRFLVLNKKTIEVKINR